MCRTKAEGGPCATHSRQRLAKAIAGGDNKRIASARLEFELTSGGIKELRAQGDNLKADLRQAERNEITEAAILEKERATKKNSVRGTKTIKNALNLNKWAIKKAQISKTTTEVNNRLLNLSAEEYWDLMAKDSSDKFALEFVIRQGDNYQKDTVLSNPYLSTEMLEYIADRWDLLPAGVAKFTKHPNATPELIKIVNEKVDNIGSDDEDENSDFDDKAWQDNTNLEQWDFEDEQYSGNKDDDWKDNTNLEQHDFTDKDDDDWKGHSTEPVSEDELKRLIAEDYNGGKWAWR